MKTPLIHLFLLILLGCGNSDNSSDDNPDQDQGSTDSDFFTQVEVSELSTQVVEGYAKGFERNSMSVGFVELISGQMATRPQTNFDEVFFVFSGEGTLKVGPQTVIFGTGDVIAAKGDQETHLTTKSEAQVIVVTLKENAMNPAENFTHYSQAQISRFRNNQSNSWNPFLREPNVIFGLYALPQALGGDQTLTHTWDELNIVTTGNSQFTMNGVTIPVKRGSVVFVDKSIGHFFNQLTSDTDIMILWEQ